MGGRFYSKVGTQGTSAYWYSGAFPTAIEAARARRDYLSTQQGTKTKPAVFSAQGEGWAGDDASSCHHLDGTRQPPMKRAREEETMRLLDTMAGPIGMEAEDEPNLPHGGMDDDDEAIHPIRVRVRDPEPEPEPEPEPNPDGRKPFRPRLGWSSMTRSTTTARKLWGARKFRE